MILLSKLDGTKVLLNFESVKHFEASGDTRIVFLNGDIMIVKESIEEVQESMLKLQSEIVKRSQH